MKNEPSWNDAPFDEPENQSAAPFDWRDYALALKQRLWLILLCAVGGVGIAVYQVSKAIPIYASRTVLMMEAKEDRVLKNIESVKSDMISDNETLRTMIETLTSRTMLSRVAERLKLDPGSLVGTYKITKRGDTRLLDVVAEHEDPEMAQKLADELVQEFLRFRLESKKNSNEMANQFLIEEANKLKEKINKAEVVLHDFREKKGLISLEKDMDVVVSRFKELNTQLNQSRDRRLQLEADMADARRIGSNTDELVKLASVMQHPLVSGLLASLAQKESDLALLAQRYKPKHPKYGALTTEIDGLKKRLPEACLSAATAMSSTFEGAKQQEQRLGQEVAGQEKATYALSKMQVEYDALKRDIETDKAVYDSVLSRLKETDLTRGLDQQSIKVVEPAVASSVPVRPNKQKMIGMWSVGGVALGFLLALGLHFMDSSLKTVPDAERTLGLPVLAAVTVSKPTAKKNPKPDLETIHHKHSPVAESFRTLRASISLLGNSAERKVIMFTSAVPAEGKTYCASNYAVALAQQGLTTILLDCDLRKPSVEEIFLSNGHDNGLTQVLAEQCTLAEAIEPSGVGGLDIMPSGLRPPNPSELLSGARFKVLLRELAAKYDRIVIDTPPVMAVSDALILAPQVDIVCLVVRAQRTPRHSSSRTSIALAKAGRAPSGIVLNRLPITTAGYYYYYAGTYGKKRVYGEATAG